jgi:hypothetical protein
MPTETLNKPSTDLKGQKIDERSAGEEKINPSVAAQDALADLATQAYRKMQEQGSSEEDNLDQRHQHLNDLRDAKMRKEYEQLREQKRAAAAQGSSPRPQTQIPGSVVTPSSTSQSLPPLDNSEELAQQALLRQETENKYQQALAQELVMLKEELAEREASIKKDDADSDADEKAKLEQLKALIAQKEAEAKREEDERAEAERVKEEERKEAERIEEEARIREEERRDQESEAIIVDLRNQLAATDQELADPKTADDRQARLLELKGDLIEQIKTKSEDMTVILHERLEKINTKMLDPKLVVGSPERDQLAKTQLELINKIASLDVSSLPASNPVKQMRSALNITPQPESKKRKEEQQASKSPSSSPSMSPRGGQ